MSMTFEDWEALVIPTKREPEELGELGLLLYQSNGMAGEAGEVSNEVKKLVRSGDNGGRADEVIVEECGDVLFYMSRLLKQRGLRVEDAAHALLNKLENMKTSHPTARSGRIVLVIGPVSAFKTWEATCKGDMGDAQIYHIERPEQLQGFCLARGEGEVVDLTNDDPAWFLAVEYAKSVICQSDG
jgi:NTP pyrophosphatase (non-canonical NTP hydrolase)